LIVYIFNNVLLQNKFVYDIQMENFNGDASTFWYCELWDWMLPLKIKFLYDLPGKTFLKEDLRVLACVSCVG